MKIMTKAKYVPYKGEKNDDKKITETAGYIPKNIQIENMMIAGYNLGMARKERYDFGSMAEVDEKFSDPTRRWSYDPAEASRDAREANARLSVQKRLHEIKAEEIAKQKLEEQQKKVTTVTPDAS